MQKLKAILCILCLQFFVVGLLYAQTAKVWVTIPNESDVPYFTTDSSLAADPTVNSGEFSNSQILTVQQNQNFYRKRLKNFFPESEQLEIKKVHFNELYQMVIDGKITDAITVAAVLKYNAIKPKI